MLNEENPTITDFCKKYDVSRSTVSRKFEHLKNHLKQFQLRFTYTESNLVGDERLVRLSLFNIIWLGVRGSNGLLPFLSLMQKLSSMSLLAIFLSLVLI